ncbi:MAG: hypothetical protein ACP5N1_06420 [Candidatus Woesearchaeota archaeon]
MESDKQNLDIILNKISEEYINDINPKSGRLTTIKLKDKAKELGISLSEKIMKYNVIVPGLNESLFVEITHHDFNGNYLQTDKGLIIPNALKESIIQPHKEYMPPKAIYVAFI